MGTSAHLSPLAHSVGIKENYSRIKTLMDALKSLQIFQISSGWLCRSGLGILVNNNYDELVETLENMGEYSEEQGERFHQDMPNFERRYQGQCNKNMMGDNIPLLNLL
ncbi:hypothetical protein J437_LFUL009993 [Ladona fulva]|uniref:Uncharacterized protein n=1 Tax=Ladona fulva TaxID=123851 RepID=A0A8K0K7X2_LADFU|nr:hypothetical protein J437_LFUL009993 [Ladona fulva]